MTTVPFPLPQPRTWLRTCLLLAWLLVPSGAHAGGRTVQVGTMPRLLQALESARAGDRILLQDGTYRIKGRFALKIDTHGITIQGRSGDPARVVIRGQGMRGKVNHGFFVMANRVTIRDITIEQVANHGIQTHVDTDHLHVMNCILRDTYEQMLKVPFRKDIQDPSENGVVENCLFEYSAGVAPNWYTGGVDVHFGRGWIIRNNTFRNIQSPGKAIAEHAIHFWTNSSDTLVEGNSIINCDRGIGFGMGQSRHTGGVIRNNAIVHDGSGRYPDVGIVLESASGCRVYNNTIFFTHDRYPNAIEYRFKTSRNNRISNNLSNRRITARDGGQAALEANLTSARLLWFKDPVRGDLRLTTPFEAVVDRGIHIEELKVDMAGSPRPLGRGVDIGAHEWDPYRK